MIEQFTPVNYCPYCGHKFDMASDAFESERPKPGDASVCMYCAGILVLRADLTTRLPDQEESMILRSDPRIQKVQRAIRTVKAQMS